MVACLVISRDYKTKGRRNMRDIKDIKDEPTTWFLVWSSEPATREQVYEYVFGSVGKGWHTILLALLEMLELLCSKVMIAQVKEKFGTLRFYTGPIILKENLEHWHVPNFDEAISWTEYLSGYICERCGQPGTLREGGWLKTLCDTCDSKRKEKG